MDKIYLYELPDLRKHTQLLCSTLIPSKHLINLYLGVKLKYM